MPDSAVQPAPSRKDQLAAMSFLQHLEELRRRIIWSLLYIMAGFFACWWKADVIYRYMKVPIDAALARHHQDPSLYFTNPTTAARTALDRTRSATGCLVVIEVIVMIRPQCFRCMWGMTSRAKYTVLRKFNSMARCHSSRVTSRNPLAGGPPALVTQMSTLPNLAATAAT